MTESDDQPTDQSALTQGSQSFRHSRSRRHHHSHDCLVPSTTHYRRPLQHRLKMIGRTTRAAAPAITRRTFTSTRAQQASPFHYPEGPRSNLPFNPKTRFFAVRYWGFMFVGFGIPFGEAVWQTYKN